MPDKDFEDLTARPPIRPDGAVPQSFNYLGRCPAFSTTTVLDLLLLVLNSRGNVEVDDLELPSTGVVDEVVQLQIEKSNSVLVERVFDDRGQSREDEISHTTNNEAINQGDARRGSSPPHKPASKRKKKDSVCANDDATNPQCAPPLAIGLWAGTFSTHRPHSSQPYPFRHSTSPDLALSRPLLPLTSSLVHASPTRSFSPHPPSSAAASTPRPSDYDRGEYG
ncbi:unnamed protein product [Cyclocybe aegerita]|uniref:Uncharacterized protein n=1 Tax=Cyclocybe aegerita TaxID=1973307 RepID=A0A8S0XPX8_CYCAE|nr:unnamed protein product [Cyclocybe aegerita]